MLQDKPYYSLSSYYQERFGSKIAKISIDAGFTCPNRDGTLGNDGCIFCSPRGSGDFAPSPLVSISDQITIGKSNANKKWSNLKYIAYFQAFTNTYSAVDILKSKYDESLLSEDIIGISIATRPDCIDTPILDLLDEYNQKTALWVELGLQTVNEKTAALIKRGYNNAIFERTVLELSKRNIPIIVHVILGLPKESESDCLNTINYINTLPVQGIKLQLLHILNNTPLALEYKNNHIKTLSQEEYESLVISCINHLRPDIVIHRITGDGDKNNLIAPLWSLKKREVLNSIHKQMKLTGSFQGKFYFH